MRPRKTVISFGSRCEDGTRCLVFCRDFSRSSRANVPEYSIIHCPTFSHLSGLAVLAGRLLRRPTLLRVATENDVREFAEGRHWKYRLFFRLLRGATSVIAPSAAIRDELLRAGFSSERIVCFANAVDVDRFRPATPLEKAQAKGALGLSKETAVIGTVARLVERKGIDILLRAFAMVRHESPGSPDRRR